MKKFAVVIGMLFSFAVQAANIEATVNKNIISINDAFVLTITADETLNTKPDLSVLSPNFEVYSNSVSKSTYVVNGKASSTTKWQIILSANKSGKQTIPSIPVGNDFSNSVDIEVLKQGEQAKTKNQEVRYEIRTEINENRGWYVQEQIPYNVVITDIGGLQGGEPVFDNNDEWIIKSLGQPEVVSKYKNGINVREIIFKYVLFAQKSGELQIPAVRFNGYTIANNGGGIFSGNIISLNMGMATGLGFEVPINLTAPARKIYIMPAPSGYKGNWWLPAKSVEISAKFVDDNFIEGEAFSREITLKAVGVIDTQLPQLSFAESKDLKQYPQKSVGTNEIVSDEPVAIQKTTNVYIPQKSGEIEIPAIRVEWFDVTTQRIETAEVGAQKIFVKQNPKLKKTEPITKSEVIVNKDKDVPVETSQTLTVAQLISVLLSVFAVGILLGYYIFKPRKNNNAKPQCEQREYPDFIIKKANAADFRALRDALISWATVFYSGSSINTLQDIAKASQDSLFEEQIELLTAKLYNPNDNRKWNAKIFVESFKKVSKKTDKKTKTSTILPELYQ